MSEIKFIRYFALTILVIVVSAFSVAAQPPNKNKPSEDPTGNPRKARSEMKDAHKKWVTRDVPFIITEAEKKAFLALQTDEERENFIDWFWNNRDPNPDTEENEYREEYYERIAYANEHFASGIPGWKTDRGRIYITWGKPDSVESRPSGGSYDRPSYEGGGSITTYPFEIWFYRHLDGVGDGIEIEFVDRTGTGEYRIARDFDEKNANAMGAGRNTEARENNYMRQQDTPFERLRTESAMFRSPPVKFSDLLKIASGDSGVIDNNPLGFDVRVDFFKQSEDRVIATFTVQTDNKELQFKNEGGLETATINILGRITAISNKRSGLFEDSVTTNATTAELTEMKNRKSVYQKAVALTPGIYKVNVVVRDVNTGNTGVQNMGFTVPRYDEKKLSVSSLILASKLRSTNERDIGQPFVIGNAKVIPNLAGIYKQGQEVGFYIQVYNAEIDQTTLRPAVDVEYIVTKDGKEVLHQSEDWSGLSDLGQRLTLARLLPTQMMPLGDYEIKIFIKDRVGGQTLQPAGKFTIIQ